jgi:hypothetical protein
LIECAVCRHKNRAAIEEAIVSGKSYRDIAGRFGPSKTSVGRHREHLPETLTKAHEVADVARADGLLEKVVALHRKAEGILEGAERDGLLETALRAIREARSCLELLARLEGAVRENQINIVALELDSETAARIASTYLARRKPAELTP